jgi:hypothetical protein
MFVISTVIDDVKTLFEGEWSSLEQRYGALAQSFGANIRYDLRKAGVAVESLAVSDLEKILDQVETAAKVAWASTGSFGAALDQALAAVKATGFAWIKPQFTSIASTTLTMLLQAVMSLVTAGIL